MVDFGKGHAASAAKKVSKSQNSEAKGKNYLTVLTLIYGVSSDRLSVSVADLAGPNEVNIRYIFLTKCRFLSSTNKFLVHILTIY